MMVRVGLLLAAFVIGLCQARTLPNRSKQVKAYAYVLPAGAEEIRDDINHSFVCANRTDGFYVDIDNDCQIFHRCQDRARFSFICAEKTLFSQMYQTCVHDGQLGFPCEDSAMFYPDAEESSNAETETASEVDSANKEQPAAEPSAAAAMPPSMFLLPPEEESMTDAASDDEKVIGTVAMPISDNYVNMFDHQQVNDDKFDLVEEDEKENTAQEVLDEQVQDAEALEIVPQEAIDSTQEVEVNDESNESSEASSNVDEEILNETAELSSEDEETNEIVLGIESDDNNNEHEEPATVLTEEVQPEFQSQLHNDVQNVEEPEPVVQDVQEDKQQQQLEVTEVEVPQSVEPISNNDVVIEEEEDSNSVETSPSDSETVNEPKQEDEPELPLSSEETAPNSENVVAEIELNDDKQEESDQKVNEPLIAESPVVLVVDGDDEKVDDSEAAPVEASSEQELVPEADAQSPADDQNETVMNEVHPLTATLAEQVAEESRPIDLPEFIVSTVADLRRGVVPPALRRRKTFLFKADAISS
ncbi:uncharacterized protein LOC135698126 [Ochlerotatus camptorhynchus]|uniref:uncharacterized protein LOC135698126 n=1 Tax=Ochlerotatus camptorhynchus TaxID=644619 RepID=UPI0031E2AD0C